MKKPGANEINQELEKLQFAFPYLSQTMGEPQIRLNAEQYARYVELYNDPSKSPYATEYFKTQIYSGGESLMPKNVVETLKETIKGDAYKNMREFSQNYRVSISGELENIKDKMEDTIKKSQKIE